MSNILKDRLLKQNVNQDNEDGTSVERFIVNSFLIPEHPITRFSLKLKMQYLSGIQEVLCFFFVSNVKVRFCFEQLYRCLLNDTYNGDWEKPISLKKAKSAISLKFEGLKLFTMSSSFWSDIFRIISISGEQKILNQPSFLTNFANFKDFMIKNIRKIHDFFLDSKKLTDNEIERLYLNDQLFKQQKEYSILVVGNMSAGKSTLINAIVGSKVERVKSTVCTSQLKYIYNKPYEDGITMTDGFSYAWTDKVDISVLDAMHIALHFKQGTRNRRCVLIDTPGVNYANESTHLNITANALNSKTTTSFYM